MKTVSTTTAPVVDDSPTRERVAASILENGPSTAATLAERLSLTPRPYAVTSTTWSRSEPSRRGIRASTALVGVAGRRRSSCSPSPGATRSSRRTTTSRSAPCGSSASAGGPEAVADFARRRTAELEERYRPIVEAAAPKDRAAALAASLSQEGYAASVTSSPIGDQLCQHHCPVAHVAAEFPQLCEAETEVFARLLGRHVQRLATIAHGDGVCTTNVPHATTAPAAAGGRPGPQSVVPAPSGRTTA